MPKDRKKKGKKKKGGKDKEPWFGPIPSRKKARKEAGLLAKLETREAGREIDAELRGSERRQAEIPAWFSGPDGYLARLGELQQRSAGYYQQVQADIANRRSQAHQQDEAQRSTIDEEERTNAALRGTQYTGQPGATLAQAMQARRDYSNTGQDLVGLTGANQMTWLNEQQRIGAGEQINQLLKEQARERALLGDRRSLARERGEIKASRLAELRQGEREYDLAQREFGEGNKSRRTQKFLARKYASNKKKEQKRSFNNQSRLADKYAANKKAEQNRSKRNQLKVGKQQARNEKRDDARTRRRDKRVNSGGKKKGKKKGGGGFKGRGIGG